MVKISEVRNKRDLKKFVMFPIRFFKDCPNYIPCFVADEMKIMDPKKNPSLRNAEIKCWLAYRDGKIVGRIAGIIQHQDNELRNIKAVRFSRVEYIDDPEVSKALFDTVAEWGRSKGMTMMHGPWDFNDQGKEGMLCYGYDQRSTLITNWSHPYFIEHVKNYGMEDECEWVEYRFEVLPDKDDRVLRVARLIKERSKLQDKAETMSAKEIVRVYGHKIFDMLNVCYGHLEAYVPVTGEVVDDILNQFGPVADSRFMSVLVNENDDVVGFSIAIPSIAEAVRDSKGKMFPFGWMRLLRAVKHPKELEWLLIGVHPDYQARGLNAWLLARTIDSAVADGKIFRIDSDCMLTTNTQVLSQLETLPHELVRRRKCFKIDI